MYLIKIDKLKRLKTKEANKKQPLNFILPSAATLCIVVQNVIYYFRFSIKV